MGEFGERLRKALQDSGYTQKRATEELNLSKNAITNYVNGRIPDALILYNLSILTGVTMEWLISGEERSATKQNKENIKSDNRLENRDEIKLISSFAKMSAEQRKLLKENMKSYIATPGYWVDSDLDLNEEEMEVLELYRNLTNTDKLKIEGILEMNISNTPQQRNKKLYSSPDSEFAGDISVS